MVGADTMPGRRCLERELKSHDPGLRFTSCLALFRQQLPDHDRALLGWSAILDYLQGPLLLRRLNGRPINRRMVLRWRRDAGLPLIRGNHHRRYSDSPLTTAHALTAWVLSQFALGHAAGFRSVSLAHAAPVGRRPTDQPASSGMVARAPLDGARLQSGVQSAAETPDDARPCSP